MARHTNSILCLGDSYTVGEALPLYDSFPYQLVQLLRKQQVAIHAPEIIAKTGWSTFELADYLINHAFNDHYDFVTLCIGVNNQYRGLAIEDYSEEFEFLLRKAIHYADGNSQHVCVLSIPDWGVTPFANGKNAQKIATDINHFNEANKTISQKYGVQYIDITALSCEAKNDIELLAADGLHPSAKAYAAWVRLLGAWLISKV
jgi:lysophospholipase L1-like esterase